jgi:hypothetical protein
LVSVRIYVEGGGDYRALLSECRRGFSEFFRKALPAGRLPRIVACGSRNDAFDRFRTAVGENKDRFCVLLVDSEGPVAPGANPWEYLKARDKWERPSKTSDECAHMMVQCMEAWFLADKRTLASFYGQGFNSKALPSRKDVESIPKEDLRGGLARATRSTATKGEYGKGKHAFKILAVIDPARVEKASPHARRLLELLKQKTGDDP